MNPPMDWNGNCTFPWKHRACCGPLVPMGLTFAPMIVIALLASGCKSASVTEVRGKTAFGPEFRHRGDSTNEVRYDARQGLELKWDNGWTTGLTYRRRDVDAGSGDNENLFLFEVGYPIWKAPKKENAADKKVAQLEQELQELRAIVQHERSSSVATANQAGMDGSGSFQPAISDLFTVHQTKGE